MILQSLKEYEDLVPEISSEEYQSLKDSIKKHGLWMPVIVNPDGIILDGHHRFKICNEFGINTKFSIKSFESKIDEEIFVLEVNAKRRQLDDLGKHKIYVKLKPRYEKQAKERMSEGGKGGTDGPPLIKEKTRSSTQAADQVNLSRKKAEKMDYVKEQNPELYDKIGKTDRMTVNKAYVNTKKAEKKQKRHNELKKQQVSLPETIQLYNKPFQELKIKSNTVSLIFTDPPYHDKYLHLFEDLAVQAALVLRDGGSLVTYVGQGNIGKVINMMEKQGLKFHWPITVLHSGASASVFGKKVLVAAKIMLWFQKGKYSGEFVRDVIKSEFEGKELHEWAQSTKESDYYIKYMTIENEIVYDPFLGSGTFGISAKRLKRQFIGCEVSKEHYETARRLISNAT